jgi:hypothetical protein
MSGRSSSSCPCSCALVVRWPLQGVVLVVVMQGPAVVEIPLACRGRRQAALEIDRELFVGPFMKATGRMVFVGQMGGYGGKRAGKSAGLAAAIRPTSAMA